MTEYNPDCYVVIRMTHKDKVFYKVLGGWAGSYLYGSSWRLNSGIDKCEYDIGSDSWLFYGASGSVYKCHHDSYGLRGSIIDIWQQMLDKYPNQVELLEQQNWEEKDWSV